MQYSSTSCGANMDWLGLRKGKDNINIGLGF